MFKRTTSWITVYVLLMLVTLGFMCAGIITFISTITLYLTILIVKVGVLTLLHKAALFKKRYAQIRLLVISITITLCVADLALRYVVKQEKYLNYKERNGRMFYSSNTLMQKFSFINRRFVPDYWVSSIHTGPPNGQRRMEKKEFNYPHKYNSLGLRNAEVPVAKKKNEIRILALGDSFTEGTGTPADSTWPALLQNQLQQNITDTVYTVINAGANGSDLFFEETLLREKLLPYKPDIVIVAINSTDINDVIQCGGYERFKADGTYKIKDSPWWEPFYGASMIVRMLAHNIGNYTYNFEKTGNEKENRRAAIIRLMEPLNKVIELSRTNNFKLVLVFHPLLEDLKDMNPTLQQLAGAYQQNSNVLAIDLFQDLPLHFANSNKSAEAYYWPSDLHHNSAGYKAWSELVYTRLKQRGII